MTTKMKTSSAQALLQLAPLAVGLSCPVSHLSAILSSKNRYGNRCPRSRFLAVIFCSCFNSSWYEIGSNYLVYYFHVISKFEWTELETVFRMVGKGVYLDPMFVRKKARVENRRGVLVGCFECGGRRRALSLGACNSNVLGYKHYILRFVIVVCYYSFTLRIGCLRFFSCMS